MENKYKISSSEKKIQPIKKKSRKKGLFKISGGVIRGKKQALDVFGVVTLVVAALVVVGGAVLAIVLVMNHLHSRQLQAAGNSKPKTSNSKTYTISQATFNKVTNDLASKNTSDLNGSYASNVRVVNHKNGTNVLVSSSGANQLLASILAQIGGTWTWNVSASQLAQWQNGPSGQYFTGNIVVGVSSDGTVIVIDLNNSGQIVGIFVAPADTLTNSGSGTSNNGTTQNPGSSGTGTNGSGTSGTGTDTGTGSGSGTGSQTPPANTANGLD